MMTNAPVLPTAASAATATAVAPTPTDPALAGVFSDELAQRLLDEAAGDDDEVLTPEALALLLAAMVDAPAAPAAPVAAASAGSPMGGLVRQLALHGADMLPRAPDAQAALEGVLQELRASPADGRSLGDGAVPGLALAVSAQAQAADALAIALAAGPVTTSEPGSALRPMAPHIAARHDVPMQSPVGSQSWGNELASRIVMIATDGVQSASVRLSPEHLGPLDIRIAVRDGDAAVTFGASHADTRAALEQALPRLRELLAAQGLNLAESSVSDHTARQDRAPSPASRFGTDPAETPVQEAGRAVALPVGLVDLYA